MFLIKNNENRKASFDCVSFSYYKVDL